MPQRTIVITGASDGIGAAAARMLAGKGENVILVGRSEEKTVACARLLNSPYLRADFTRLDGVRTLAARLRDMCPRIDVLANNAGGIMGEREMTVDGFEKTMQVNHLAHHGQGIDTAAFHPGNVATSFASESTSWLRYVYRTPVKHLALISPEQGAERLLWLVDGAPGVDWALGEYHEKNKRARSHAQAGDQELAREFWERSAQMLGLIKD